jgi:hypothetical protein
VGGRACYVSIYSVCASALDRSTSPGYTETDPKAETPSNHRQSNHHHHPPTHPPTKHPPGVVLTHANLIADAAGTCALVDDWQPGDRHISYLPLAHIYERNNMTVGL